MQKQNEFKIDLDTVKLLGKNGLLNDKGVAFMIELSDRREKELTDKLSLLENNKEAKVE